MPDSIANPYASPETDNATELPTDVVLDAAALKRLEIGTVIVAWEKRRLWYNAILAGVSAPVALLFVAKGGVSLGHIAQLGMAAVGANVCYCAGPIVEGYWTWLFGPAAWMRNVFFVLGTAASCLVAVFCIAAVFVFGPLKTF